MNITKLIDADHHLVQRPSNKCIVVQHGRRNYCDLCFARVLHEFAYLAHDAAKKTTPHAKQPCLQTRIRAVHHASIGVTERVQIWFY